MTRNMHLPHDKKKQTQHLTQSDGENYGKTEAKKDTSARVLEGV